MDKFTIHLDPVPRRFPAALQVSSVARVEKRGQLNQSFRTWNFSFILGGGGVYQVDDRMVSVVAPCVITQRPGPHYRYGPRPDGRWEELYIVYRPELGPALLSAGLMKPRRHWWRIGRPGSLHPLLRELHELAAAGGANHVDRIDRLCERLVVESLLAATRDEPQGAQAAVEAMRLRVEMAPHVDHDFEAMAADADLSPTHFRRLWNRQVGTPPARYRMQLLIQRACRELIETERSITEIALGLGFADPLYFSRRFRAIVGEAPSAYRQRFEGTASLSSLGEKATGKALS